MRTLLSILFLILGVNLYSQCDVIIQPGTLQKIDVDPGVKFSFTIKNNGTTPFQNGTFHLSFGWLDSPMNPQSVWDINLSAPIQPNGTLQEPSSTLAFGLKLFARGSIQPETGIIQDPSSTVAKGS